MSSMEQHERYAQAVKAEDQRLATRIARIVAQLDDGHITVREAADERIQAMEEHLAAVRQFRRDLLGGT